MTKPLLHPDTARDLEGISDALPHAIGIYGDHGTGLTTTAKYIAERVGASFEIVYPERQDSVDIDKGTITIDIIRRLYRVTQGKEKKARCIVITNADTMSPEAQNAFLKLLEEPTKNISFVLLIHNKDSILPTVWSRLQRHRIRQITDEQSEQLLTTLGVSDTSKRRQLLFLAKGLPALLTKLSQNEKAFNDEAELLRQARTFIQGTQYERLLICHSVRDSRDKALRMTQYAMSLLKFDITTRQLADDNHLELLNKLELALQKLANNANIRLALAEAIL